ERQASIVLVHDARRDLLLDNLEEHIVRQHDGPSSAYFLRYLSNHSMNLSTSLPMSAQPWSAPSLTTSSHVTPSVLQRSVNTRACWMGTRRSLSPCMMSIGALFFEM